MTGKLVSAEGMTTDTNCRLKGWQERKESRTNPIQIYRRSHDAVGYALSEHIISIFIVSKETLTKPSAGHIITETPDYL